MNTATLQRLSGEELEQEIEVIMFGAQDQEIRETITKRMAIARQPGTKTVTHAAAFAESRKRLLDMLSAPVASY